MRLDFIKLNLRFKLDIMFLKNFQSNSLLASLSIYLTFFNL